MERSTARVEDSADRRTELAADRTVFAAERTYAAWVRTGLVAMASGIGARALLIGTLPEWLVIATGTIFMLVPLAFASGAQPNSYFGPNSAICPTANLRLCNNQELCTKRLILILKGLCCA
jgi:putative membrane protein